MRVALLVVLVAGCNAETFTVNCKPGTPSAEALRPAERASDGSVILPDGRKLTPAGALLKVGGFPVGMRALPDNRHVVITDAGYGDQYLSIVDTQATANPIVSRVVYQRGRGDGGHNPQLFFGLALTRDGKKLYVSDGAYDPAPDSTPFTGRYNVIEVFAIEGSPPTLRKLDTEEIHLPYNGASARMPAGLALSADEQTLYVAAQMDGTLGVVDLRSGVGYGQEIGRTPILGVHPYDLLVDDARKLVWVSLWGGALVGPRQYAEGVLAVDVSNPQAPMPSGPLIPTGKASEALLRVGDTIYAAAVDGDTLHAIDARTSMAGTQVSVAFDTMLRGTSPSALAVDATRMRLYVANAGENAVLALALPSLEPLGRIPAAWYPTALATLADGTLLIASAKGLGAGPTDKPVADDDYMAGTLQVVPPPSDGELRDGSTRVLENLRRPVEYQVPVTCTGTSKQFPLPLEKGAKTPIEHVFLIVRENKTYDAVLGDLPTGNGMKELAIFGGDITPNLHALATRFTNLDNFYSLAELSIQGHEWTTANMANDYTEKAWLTTWGRATRPLGAFSPSEGLAQLSMPGSRTIWQALDDAKLPYHNYGELVNTGGALILYDLDYPGVFFNTTYADVDKIAHVIRNLEDRSFKLEPFSYVSLPNDHTVGTTPGKPTPESMVADNDEATGRFIDALSHSKYWEKSIVFIMEDDPADGGDHVELHRSPCIIASPWTRAGFTSSVHYDVPAMWKTITMLLGMPPINQRDGYAPAMTDVFADKPDARPYTFIKRIIPADLNPTDAPLAEESARIDWTQPDTAPLGRILWKAMRGREAEPPWGKKPVAFVRDDDD